MNTIYQPLFQTNVIPVPFKRSGLIRVINYGTHVIPDSHIVVNGILLETQVIYSCPNRIFKFCYLYRTVHVYIFAIKFEMKLYPLALLDERVFISLVFLSLLMKAN